MSTHKKINVLFIGNSATYVHNVPENLAKLSTEAGYAMEASKIAVGGYYLYNHADSETEHGKLVLEQLNKKYDIVFLQDNGKCIRDAENREMSKNACEKLKKEISKTGAKIRIYVRPPYGYEMCGFSPEEQCIELDALFSDIARSIGGKCSFINRAFYYALKEGKIKLYGSDNAHTSPEGAYLIICTLFSSLFNVSSTLLGTNGIDEAIAKRIQEIADAVSLKELVPWEMKCRGYFLK